MQQAIARAVDAHPHALVRTTRQLSLAGPVQLLTEVPRRQPTVAGTIHPGIKVLTKENSKYKALADIYRNGVMSGDGYNKIERDLLEAGSTAEPLRMLNLPYFVVRKGDFQDPEAADRLMQLYGTDVDTPQGVKRRLLRFPVVFPTDDESVIARHSLQAWSYSTIRFWSEWRDNQRVCMTKGSIAAGKRHFGGRPNIVNPERPVCDPHECAEYQSKACTLRGVLQFYIPGMLGVGLVRVPTGSFNSIEGILANFAQARLVRGSVAGLEKQKPFWYLTKRKASVSNITAGAQGMAVTRRQQDLIVLDSHIDMVDAIRSFDPIEQLQPAQLQASQVTDINADRGEDETTELVIAANAIGLSYDDIDRLMSATWSEEWANKSGGLVACRELLDNAAKDMVLRDQLIERAGIMAEAETG